MNDDVYRLLSFSGYSILHSTLLNSKQYANKQYNSEIISFHFKIFQLRVIDLVCMSTVGHLMSFASFPNMVLFVVDVHLSLLRLM